MNHAHTILIVDDEPAVLLGLASKIRRQGYQVVTAGDGVQALDRIKETSPDLVLSDVMMPPPNGFELRKLLSEDPKFAAIPFIFLTARTSVEDRILGLKDGADDYITKPFETEELFARIQAVFRRVNVERERTREAMKEAAQRDMERLKHEILQNFHHELRTPLTNILLPLELAANYRLDDPAELSRILRVALSNADRLESLVTDLILLNSIDQSTLNSIRQYVDLKANVIPAVQRRLDRYGEKKLTLEWDVPAETVIYAPRREFVHAVVHLADNAFKFSPENGTIRISIQPGCDGGALIQVRDEGPGIPSDLREKVFERFYQISQGDTRQADGLGVGLTIARSVFEHMEGYVRILDSDRGCQVSAFLPDRRHEEQIYG